MNLLSRAKLLVVASVLLAGALSVGCSTHGLVSRFTSDTARFAKSGTILFSQALTKSNAKLSEHAQFAPLLGYAPPTASFLPAANETWLELIPKDSMMRVYRGNLLVRELKGEGSPAIAPGVYSLEYMQKDPTWYAPDQYFTKRQLPVPAAGDPLRYRRGALGQYVIYPTPECPIHTGEVYSDDVGGIRLSGADLASIFSMLRPGTTIKVQ